MPLPSSPPRYTTWKALTAPIVRGEEGWRVYALETGLRTERQDSSLVGVFNTGLVRAVHRFQRNHGLTADGIVGPRTQFTILAEAAKRADEMAGLPDGLSLGFVTFEGGSVLAATNWISPGGVDVGPVQKRLVGPPFKKTDLKQFFDPWQATKWAARNLAATRADFLARRPSLGKKRALRVAILAHNWPAGADQIVRNGRLDRPDEPAMWAPKPGGGHYTRGEWAEVYPNRILTFVA